MKLVINIIFIFLLFTTCKKEKSADASPDGWFALNSGTTKILRDVFFIDNKTGFCVGESGTIIKTTNSGNSWTGLPITTSTNFSAVFFTSKNVGYVVGENKIFKTYNGGDTWSVTLLDSSSNLLSVHFSDASHGYVAGFNGVYKTTNAGLNWTLVNPQNFAGVQAIDSSTAHIVGNALAIQRTTDGGSTWNNPPFGMSMAAYIFLYSNCFPDASTGYIVGCGNNGNGLGTILKTVDGGSTWSIKKENDFYNFYDVHFPEISTGFICGYDYGNNKGLIYKTTDGGNSWTQQTAPGSTVLSGIFFTSDTTGYAVGYNGQVFKTINGGDEE